MQFKKAVKTKQYLRLAIDGISGSGKTYTALATAMGMAEAMDGKVALIDSEHGSASLYADRFEFDTLELTEFQIEDYVKALDIAKEAGYKIVIIDSTSHAWNALLERVDKIASLRYGGNSFRAWEEGTPLQLKLVEAMLTYPGHIIVTCRSKTEYSVDKDKDGKTKITKVGTAAVQRAGFEYEFTMAMTMDASHTGTFSKDRTGKFQDKYIEKPGKEFGKQLIAWLNEGAVGEAQIQSVLQEIGNIVKSKSEKDEPYFSDDVINSIRKECKDSANRAPEDRLEFLEAILEDMKKLLHQQIEAEDAAQEPEQVVTETVLPPAEKPAAPAPKKAPEKKEAKSLKDEYDKMIQEKETGKQQTTETTPNAAPVAEVEHEPADDGFEDDIPGEEEYAAAASNGELDIF
jgi:hypothetical protein